jgi:RNA polymerase sigma-70 factor (ECF subfamily)
MLTETAVLAMPPTASWYSGRDAVIALLRRGPLGGASSWRLVPTSANGQVAMGAYVRGVDLGPYMPYGVTVLRLDGELIEEIDTFRDPSALARFGLPAQL